MGDVIRIPWRAPALRAISNPLASEEQRNEAIGFIRDTCPEDLHWAFPGEPVSKTRLPTEEEIKVVTPQKFVCRSAGSGGSRRSPPNPAIAIIGVIVISLAFYGAVRLGGDTVRLMLGVAPHIQTERLSDTKE